MSDKKIRIVLIDNQNLFRQALKRILDHELNFEVVAEGNNVDEAKKLIQEKNPDIVLTEINIAEIESIFEECSSNTRVIILSDHDDECFVTQALKLGAQG
ncbi:response regulator transcription factor, partial [Oceanobacillus caeni]